MALGIYVVPILDPPPVLIDSVVNRFSAVFAAEPRVISCSFDAQRAFDPARRQYNSTSLLVDLLGMLPEPGARIMGVTDADLFIPILTFVFGEAQLDGPAAVTSSCRLHNEFYGLPGNHDLLVERLEKECLHEIGHTLNLIHCDSYDCVMHSSTSVEEIDIKGRTFCATCQERVDHSAPPG